MEWFKRFYSNQFIDLVGFASEEQTELEATFVKKVMRLPAKASVLDLCCGYGRHTQLLARISDWRMTGMDLSEDYLEIARNRFAAPNVVYHQGDMRNIPFDEKFDGLINLFTSFGFFETDEENESVLRQIHTVLRKDGFFLLDYENKFYFVANDVIKKRRDWREGKDGKYYLIENEYDVLREREIFKVSLIRNGKEKVATGYNIRLYSYPEIRRMLLRNGFEIVNVWGDYDGSDFSVESRRLITLSRKI